MKTISKTMIAVVLFGLVAIAVAYFSLTTSTYHSLDDEEIDPALHSQMRSQSLAVLNALKDEQYDVVMGLFSPTADAEKTQNALPEIRSKMGDMLGSARFRGFHDHYVTGLTEANASTTVISAHALADEPGAYFVHQNTDTENSYISLFTSEAGPTEILYTIIWGEYAEGWKIRSLNIALLGWSGRRGPDWLEEVQRVRATSGDTAAYLTFKAVSALFRPSPLFEWKDVESQAKALYQEIAPAVAGKLNGKTVIQELESKPAIYGLDATTADDLPGQVIPVVSYVSKYPLSEVDRIQDEAQQMAPLLEKYFDGVTKLGTNILFTAYAEPPTDPKKKYHVFRTAVEID